MQKEDIKLRLPCDDDLYEEDQAETRTPFFDNGYIDKRLTRLDERSTAPGMMAYLVQLTAILGDIFRQACK